MSQKPIINCHTHIFTGDNIPPYIGKKFMPVILYRILTVPLIIGICKFWFTSKYSPYKFNFSFQNSNLKKNLVKLKLLWQSFGIVRTFVDVIGFLLVIFSSYILFKYFFKEIEFCENLLIKLYNIPYLEFLKKDTVQIIIILFTLIAIPYGRKIAMMLFRNSKKLSLLFINEDQLKFITRYVNIGRFAYYKEQNTIFKRLKGQYPKDTQFVILPMDMEFMDAGKVKPIGNYQTQMEKLKILKQKNPNIIHPFIFVDPRRENVGYADFFKWRNDNGKVVLEECFIKDYIEKANFAGFKIYPALGYFPFDEKLLALWKYAADNNLPIMTHCIRGTIFYRGNKKKEWYYHPIIKDAKLADEYMLLSKNNNIEYSVDFTHPLNYLCLLNPFLLKEWIKKCNNTELFDLFGYSEATDTITSDLSNLKICFGHYGGDDEWKKFLERDRDNYSHKMVDESSGIKFLNPKNPETSYGGLMDIWKNADWYTVISSLMMQYPNVYADLSYIIHNQEIFPLLKKTINNPLLKDRILFGTDFYVVRNHNSEKELLATTMANLSTEEFDLIARENPINYLKRNLFQLP
jgi:predicted TIM-barrel fold metal-dependent hydrolase